jgi:hypothetical protein
VCFTTLMQDRHMGTRGLSDAAMRVQANPEHAGRLLRLGTSLRTSMRDTATQDLFLCCTVVWYRASTWRLEDVLIVAPPDALVQ